MRVPSVNGLILPSILVVVTIFPALIFVKGQGGPGAVNSIAISLRSPAGNLPTSRAVDVGGISAAVLPNGRFITPAGIELSVRAPKPYGMALSRDGNTLATVNS